MNINSKNLVSITKANQNFSEVARLVDTNGSVVILKNNVPRYVIIDFNAIENEEMATDEEVLALSKRFLDKNKEAYLKLAK